MNGVESKQDNYGILWLNEKHAEEGLNQKNSPQITKTYLSDHRKHRHELLDEQKNQSNRLFIDEK